MKRWLESRGESTEMKMQHMSHDDMEGMDMSHHQMLMPGMLTAKQMDALKKCKRRRVRQIIFDWNDPAPRRSLDMVKDLFDTAGGGQDAQMFNFATDVDSGQRAEIKIMQEMLGEKP
jgi:uncharacterized protein (DUF305 family)